MLIAELIRKSESIDWMVSRVARKHITGVEGPERTDPSIVSMGRGRTARRITGLGLSSLSRVYG